MKRLAPKLAGYCADDFDPDGPSECEGLFGLPHTEAQALVHILPVPFEATASSHRGTSGAPAAVLKASWQVDLHDLETGDAWREGIVLAHPPKEARKWNERASALALPIIEQAPGLTPKQTTEACQEVDEFMERLHHEVARFTRERLALGKVPAVLGGDHSVPLGAIRAASEAFPGLGILHIDAHADLRVAYQGFTYSHASIFHNVLAQAPDITALTQVGIRDLGEAEARRAEEDSRIHFFDWPGVVRRLHSGDSWHAIATSIIDTLPDQIWISLDIDGLNPALCPGTGTPVPGGLDWDQCMTLLRLVEESGKRIVGFDLCEVGTSAWDATVGARILYKLASWAIRTQAR